MTGTTGTTGGTGTNRSSTNSTIKFAITSEQLARQYVANAYTGTAALSHLKLHRAHPMISGNKHTLHQHRRLIHQ